MNGPSFASVVDIAHRYNEDILAPTGIPLGDAYAIEGSGGILQQYGYDMLGELGGVNVYLKTPQSSGDFGLAHDGYIEIRRASITVHGSPALLIQLQYEQEPRHDAWVVVWSETGRVVEVHGATAETDGFGVTPGPDALISVANAIQRIPVSKVDVAGILGKVPPRLGDEFEGQVSTVTDIRVAQGLLGATLRAPNVFSFIHVFHSGWLRSYTVDLDQAGGRRLFVVPFGPPTAAEASAPGVIDFQMTAVGNNSAVYEKVRTSLGAVSLLFFQVNGARLMLRDSGGASASDLQGAAMSVLGDGMALDADPSTPAAIDATRTITGTAQFSLGINVTADADPYKGYQWEIEYPPTGLAFDGSVVDNTSATGLGVCTNAAANPNVTPITGGDTVFGNGAGCLTTSGTFQSSYVGQTTTFKMHCLTAGTYAVQLLDTAADPGFGTTLIAADSSTLNTSTSGITITCQ